MAVFIPVFAADSWSEEGWAQQLTCSTDGSFFLTVRCEVRHPRSPFSVCWLLTSESPASTMTGRS